MKSVLPANAMCRWLWPTPPKLKKRLTVTTARMKPRIFSQILKELSSDSEIAREVSEAGVTEDAKLVESLANEAPIVKFVNLVFVSGHSGPRQ